MVFLTASQVYAYVKDYTSKFGSGITSWAGITGKPSSYPTTWGDVAGKPSLFPTSIATISEVAAGIEDAEQIGGQNAALSYLGTVQQRILSLQLPWNHIDAPQHFPTTWDLVENKPALSNFSGTIDWASITGKPSFFDGSYTSLTNKPSLFSGSYNDLTNKPTIYFQDLQVRFNDGYGPFDLGWPLPNTVTIDWSRITNKVTQTWSTLTGKPAAFPSDWSVISNKPSFFSGAYADLTGKPTLFDGSYLSLTNRPTTWNWANLVGAPSTFPTNWADVSGKPTALSSFTDDITPGWVKTAISTGANPTTGNKTISFQNTCLGVHYYNGFYPGGTGHLSFAPATDFYAEGTPPVARNTPLITSWSDTSTPITDGVFGSGTVSNDLIINGEDVYITRRNHGDFWNGDLGVGRLHGLGAVSAGPSPARNGTGLTWAQTKTVATKDTFHIRTGRALTFYAIGQQWAVIGNAATQMYTLPNGKSIAMHHALKVTHNLGLSNPVVRVTPGACVQVNGASAPPAGAVGFGALPIVHPADCTIHSEYAGISALAWDSLVLSLNTAYAGGNGSTVSHVNQLGGPPTPIVAYADANSFVVIMFGNTSIGHVELHWEVSGYKE